MSTKTDVQVSSKGKLKFIIGAALGAFLFLMPIPTGDGAFNIPLGIVIDWLHNLLNYGEANTEDIRVWIAYFVVTFSFLGTILAHLFKPKWIMNHDRLREVLLASPLYIITRILAFAIMTMVLFDFGPAAVIDRWDGGGLMVFDFITTLTTIFLVLTFAIPLLTDFGLMEFIGVLIKKFVNKLFTLPGRASVDLVASWFGSSVVSVIITRDQHEKGFYTGREAAVICANFALVSVPFSLVVAGALELESHFLLWYLIISLVCVILGVLMPRIWPFRKLPDTYLEGVDKQIDEEVEEGNTRFNKALTLASVRAEKVTLSEVVTSGINSWINSFLDLFPIVITWGTIAVLINTLTPIFRWLSWPFGLMLEALNVPGGAAYAPAAVIGFVDMYLPAVFLGSEIYFETRFILGALSIVQVIYLAETGALILKSKIPLGFGKLLAIFLMRTIIGLPLIVLFTWILTTLGWIG